MRKIRKVLGVGLLVLFGVAIWDVWMITPMPKLFLNLWSADIRQLKAEARLPSELDELHAVALQPLNQEAQDIIDEIQHPFSTHTDGKFTLEILMDVWEEDQQKGVSIQYDLISKDGNTIWELSRTILLPESSSLILSWYSRFFHSQ